LGLFSLLAVVLLFRIHPDGSALVSAMLVRGIGAPALHLHRSPEFSLCNSEFAALWRRNL
jgi:hypothetical protein